jgi:hypothetical protein
MRRVGAKVALALALAMAGAAALGKEAGMDEAVFGKQERVFIGRFSLEVPQGAKRYGDEFKVRYLSLREVAFAEPLDKAFDSAWAAKLAEIEQLKARRLDPDEIVGDIQSQHVLEPNRFAAVLYHTDNVKIAVQYAALKQVDAAGLWLTCPGDTVDVRETLAIIKLVGNAYQPRPPGAPRAKGDVLHLPHGTMLLAYHDQERVSSSFNGGPLEAEIEFTTEAVSKPEGGGLMARFGTAVFNAGAAFVAGISPVRSRGRKVAGMSGEELVLRDSETGRLSFLWEFKGEAESGTRPKIQLEMVAPDNGKVTMAYWDSLVDSLRPAAAP